MISLKSDESDVNLGEKTTIKRLFEDDTWWLIRYIDDLHDEPMVGEPLKEALVVASYPINDSLVELHPAI